MSLGIGGHQAADMRTDVWLTPPDILKRLGEFDLDPCAPEKRPWPTAQKHYSLPWDGLAMTWKGRVWLNPPYSGQVGAWLAKLKAHGDGIALVFARTETTWFFDHVWNGASGLLFIKGRLSFHLADGSRSESNAGAPSVLIAYGMNNAIALAASGIKGAYVPQSKWI